MRRRLHFSSHEVSRVPYLHHELSYVLDHLDQCYAGCARLDLSKLESGVSRDEIA